MPDSNPVADGRPDAEAPHGGTPQLSRRERHQQAKERRRQEWFDRAARALAVVRPELSRGYGCPLCLKLIPSLEHLRDEHVPPAHVGGRPLLLTCEWCNHRSGHELDYHIGAGQHVRDVFAGRASTRGRFTQEGRTLNAEISFGESPHFRIHDGNHEDVVKAALEQARLDVASGRIPGDIRVELQFKYSEWKEEVAWLRVGYLYAFAAFGYRYGLQALLRRVREQILLHPAERLLPGLVRCVTPPGVPRRLILVREPGALRGVVLVSLGDRLIFLPPLGGNESFYDRMAALPASGAFNFHALVSFELPRWPIFGLDLYESFYRRVYVESVGP